MNNNMPNNFNNGMPNGDNKPINGAFNPQQQAKEQLVGGQSTVGNGPDVMQGQPNVQNDRGVMQGMANVPNNPGVMQGNAIPNKPEVPPVMPGQNHSGINAVTMQKEEVKKDEPGVVSIPNFGSTTPEPPKPVQPNPVPGPKPVNQMNSGMPNMDQSIKNPLNQINTPNIGPSVNEIKPAEPVKQSEPVKDSVGVNPSVNGPVMPNEPLEPKKPVSDNIIGNEPINQAPNPMEQVNNQNLNSFPFENINQMSEPKPQPAMGSVMNNQNVIGDAPKDLNDSITGGARNILNRGMSQVGVTQMNNSENDVVEMPEVPNKKIPLSTREMILIGVALIGIVAVVIMYWPK